MKKNNLTKGALAVLLLSSTVVGADQQYPAADFQPEVLYQNSDYIAKDSAKAATPAAKVAAQSATVTETDAKYPAADFKPEVLYHDPNYKASAPVKSATSKAASTSVATSAVEEDTAATTNAPKAEDSSLGYLLGLVALALAGFFLFKKSSATTTASPAPRSAVAKTSYAVNTGVAKYLNKISGTGVSRYIKENTSTTKATGVAKYVAKQAIASKQDVAKAATGVDKYVRDRG